MSSFGLFSVIDPTGLTVAEQRALLVEINAIQSEVRSPFDTCYTQTDAEYEILNHIGGQCNVRAYVSSLTTRT